MHASWPVAGPIDEHLLRMSAYLFETVRECRARLTAIVKKTGKPAALTAPSRATIFVAKHYVAWRQRVLSELSRMHKVLRAVQLQPCRDCASSSKRKRYVGSHI